MDLSVFFTHLGVSLNGGTQQPWFSTKNDHFGVFWGYHHLRKPPRFLDPLAQAVAECPRPAEFGSPRGKWRKS